MHSGMGSWTDGLKLFFDWACSTARLTSDHFSGSVKNYQQTDITPSVKAEKKEWMAFTTA